MSHAHYMAANADGLLSLERPDGMLNDPWVAISTHLDRLNRAISSGDRSWIVGSVKELAESVARVVLAARGETPAANEDFPRLVTLAHNILGRQPGRDLSDDPVILRAVKGAMSTIKAIGEIRNKVGTGHGRPQVTTVDDEVVLVVVDGTMMWCRWALRRVGVLLSGLPGPLIEALDSGTIFYGGDLARKIAAANLPQMADGDMGALAAAVARRAMTGTFVVREEGVDAAAFSDDTSTWPHQYRGVLMTSLLLNKDVEIDTAAWAINRIAMLLANAPKPEASAFLLEVLSAKAMFAPRMNTDTARAEVARAMSRETTRVPGSAREHWEAVRRYIAGEQ